MELNILELNRTSYACPAQWEGILDDGRMVYIRERWNELTIRVSPEPTDDIFDAVRGDYILYINANVNDIDDVVGYAGRYGIILNLPDTEP